MKVHKKRILFTLLINLALIITMTPCIRMMGGGASTVLVVCADDAVAVNADTGDSYTTLSAAVGAAEEGQTIRLLIDVDTKVTIDKKKLTLDLNGKTLSSEGITLTVANGAEVTLTGGGTVSTTGSQRAVSVYNSALAVDGANVTSSSIGISVYTNTENATDNASATSSLTLKSGTITGTGNAAAVTTYGYSTLTMNGGTVQNTSGSSSQGALSLGGSFASTISGGTITMAGGSGAAVTVFNGSLTVSGDDTTITSGGSGAALKAGSGKNSGAVTIESGFIKASGDSNKTLALGTTDSSITIKGGAFSDDEGNDDSFTRPSGKTLNKDTDENSDTYGYYILKHVDHDWGDPTYSWAADNSSVTASRSCKVEGCNEADTETVSTTSKVVKAATCEEKGETTYTSKAFDNTAFSVQTKTVETAALGHDWGEPTYTWADDNSSVTATRVCKTDAAHKEEETVKTTSKVVKAATCKEKGETTYTAAFENEAFKEQTKTVDDIAINENAHDWDAGEITKEATTTEEGARTYTCTVCGATKTENIPKKEEESSSTAKSTVRTVIAAKGIASGKKAVNISWNNVKADRYVIYLARCNSKGKTYKFKKVKTVSGNKYKWKKAGLNKKTAYRFKVVAQKKVNGKYKTIATSKVGHVFTGNVSGKYTNPKALTLKRSAFTLAKGKTATIKGTVVKAKKNKKLGTGHAKKLRFTSNDPTVATVDASGKITAKSAGTATIYVQTINGIWKTVKVTVK